MGDPMSRHFFTSAFICLLLSCGAPSASSPGQWKGTVEDQMLQVTWQPRQPRVGDYVDLAVSPGLEELTLDGGRDLPVARSATGARFRLLMREAGDFHPLNWPQPLWTVPPENNFPEGWQSLEAKELFPPFIWKDLFLPGLGILGLAAAATSFLTFRRKKPLREPPGEEFTLLGELESAKARLHGMTPGELKSLPALLDRGWKHSPENVPDLEGAWFYRKDLDWDQLETRYRNRRELALYAGREADWETWEEELDVVLYRLRRGHV